MDYFNPRSPRGERPAGASGAAPGLDISIHAPREGSDGGSERGCAGAGYFNPRSPRGERPFFISFSFGVLAFQSTLPARGATRERAGLRRGWIFQSTLPARGATSSCARLCLRKLAFQSTLPARGATGEVMSWQKRESISIHAPARGATGEVMSWQKRESISIHAPREGSDQLDTFVTLTIDISIHAPREGSDRPPRRNSRVRRHFNPRSPRGERLRRGPDEADVAKFQSTLPARGATPAGAAVDIVAGFQSTLPARGATPSLGGDGQI